MPDESVVKQLLFAEGLAGFGELVGRPRSMWRDRALVALRLVSRLAGWGWYGVAQDRAQWYALCERAQPAARSPLPCYARHRHALLGSAPCNSDSDVWVWVLGQRGRGRVTGSRPTEDVPVLSVAL
eukprot:366007-Chlamydomonas_euryale.AAC.10